MDQESPFRANVGPKLPLLGYLREHGREQHRNAPLGRGFRVRGRVIPG